MNDKLAGRAKAVTGDFSLSAESVQNLIILGEKRTVMPVGNWERHEFSVMITAMIEAMDSREQWELMCLLYFGRNIDYYGFDAEAVADLEDHIRNPWRGSTDPEYLAGKTPIGKWLRMATEVLG